MAEALVDSGPQYLGLTAATVFTATNKTAIGKIHVSNSDVLAHTVTISITADTGSKRIYDAFIVAANNLLDDNGPYLLAAGAIIQAFSSAANVMTIYIAGVDGVP